MRPMHCFVAGRRWSRRGACGDATAAGAIQRAGGGAEARRRRAGRAGAGRPGPRRGLRRRPVRGRSHGSPRSSRLLRGLRRVRPGNRVVQGQHHRPVSRLRVPTVDVRSEVYNPSGSVAPERFRFPYDDGAFTFALASSLFTHLVPAALERYLSELARVLEPGGRLMATFFLVADGDSGWLALRDGHAALAPGSPSTWSSTRPASCTARSSAQDCRRHPRGAGRGAAARMRRRSRTSSSRRAEPWPRGAPG